MTIKEAQTHELIVLIKLKGVYLLSRGKNPCEIAEVLMLDIHRIGNYRKRYEAGSVSGLLKNNYFASEPMLSYIEREEFSAHF